MRGVGDFWLALPSINQSITARCCCCSTDEQSVEGATRTVSCRTLYIDGMSRDTLDDAALYSTTVKFVPYAVKLTTSQLSQPHGTITPRLHDTNGCTDRIVSTNFLSNRLSNWLDNRLDRVSLPYLRGKQPEQQTDQCWGELHRVYAA